MKYCQGTRCHTYDTKDRKKGSKDNKRNETRKRTSFYYGNGNFCSLNCQNDWFATHGDNAINHFGRVEKPIILTEDNAWNRRYNIIGGITMLIQQQQNIYQNILKST